MKCNIVTVIIKIITGLKKYAHHGTTDELMETGTSIFLGSVCFRINKKILSYDALLEKLYILPD